MTTTAPALVLVALVAAVVGAGLGAVVRRLRTPVVDAATLIRALPVPAAIFDRAGVVTEANDAWRALPAAAVDAPDPLARAVGGERAAGVPVRRGDRYHLATAAALRDGAGRPAGGVVVEIDTTEQHEAAERCTALLATLDMSAFMARDTDGTIRAWSTGCEHLYGWTAAEAIGESSHALLRTEFPESLAAVERSLATTRRWRGDLRHLTRDGRALTVTAQMARRDGVAAAEVLEWVTDVTDQRRAEAALAENEGRLRVLAASLEDRVRAEIRARDDAQTRLAKAEKLSALGQLAGGIAHDFNNLLQSIGSAADLIGHQCRDAAKVARLAGTVAETAGRGAAITGRLLAFAKRSDLRHELIDADVFMVGMTELLRHTIGMGVAYDGDGAPATLRIRADRDQLETALVNLATNARDASGPNGSLRLVVRLGHVAADGGNPAAREAVGSSFRPGEYVGLGVVDDGTGMTPEVLARVTEPFFTTKEPGRGTGLGLAMARGFTEQSRGGLTLESAPGRGTSATLWFPLAAREAAPAAPPPVATATTPLNNVSLARAHVLLVDDDDLVRAALESQLRVRGYEVIPAEGGEEALALLRDPAVSCDLLLSDYAMPAMTGLALIAEAQRIRTGLRAVLLTGFVTDDAELAVEGARSGAFTLLRKPITGQALSARIEEMLRPEPVV